MARIEEDLKPEDLERARQAVADIEAMEAQGPAQASNLDQSKAAATPSTSAAKDITPDGLEGTRLESAPELSGPFYEASAAVEQQPGRPSEMVGNQEPEPRPQPPQVEGGIEDSKAFDQAWTQEQQAAADLELARQAVAEIQAAEQGQGQDQQMQQDMGR